MEKNKTLSAAGKRYLKEIKRFLPCRGRKKLITDLKRELLAFCEENPGSDERAILARFGAPKEVADAFLSRESILPGKGQKTAKIVLAVLLIAAVILIGLVAAMIKQNNERKQIREGEPVSDGTIVT